MGAVPFGFLSIHSENMGSFSFMMAHVVIDVFQMVQYFQTIPMSRWICESLDMARSEDNHLLDDLRRKPLLHMPT